MKGVRIMKIKDSKLLTLIAIKDENAFDAFYNRYIRMIYKYVYKELGDQDQTDDLIQDFWARLWTDPSFLRCDQSGSVRGYMLQYLKFRILDLYRKTLSGLMNETNFDLMEEVLESYECITAEMSEKELHNIIHDALKDLPPVTRKAFWMRINNWSVKETARTLSVSPKTVYNKYSKSLNVVRNYIRDNYPELAEMNQTRLR